MHATQKPSLIHRAMGLQWQQAAVRLTIIPVSLMANQVVGSEWED